MGRLLIEVEDQLLEELERVAPEPSGKQSEFVSFTIRKALWELEEQKTAEAYARPPYSDESAYFDPGSWER